jgi:hypothetical protein
VAPPDFITGPTLVLAWTAKIKDDPGQNIPVDVEHEVLVLEHLAVVPPLSTKSATPGGLPQLKVRLGIGVGVGVGIGVGTGVVVGVGTGVGMGVTTGVGVGVGVGVGPGVGIGVGMGVVVGGLGFGMQLVSIFW